jgi:hypothetical protein
VPEYNGSAMGSLNATETLAAATPAEAKSGIVTDKFRLCRISGGQSVKPRVVDYSGCQ